MTTPLPHPAIIPDDSPQLWNVIKELEAGTYPQPGYAIWRDDLPRHLAARLARATGASDEQITATSGESVMADDETGSALAGSNSSTMPLAATRHEHPDGAAPAAGPPRNSPTPPTAQGDWRAMSAWQAAAAITEAIRTAGRSPGAAGVTVSEAPEHPLAYNLRIPAAIAHDLEFDSGTYGHAAELIRLSQGIDAVTILRAETGPGWTTIALKLGYADPAGDPPLATATRRPAPGTAAVQSLPSAPAVLGIAAPTGQTPPGLPGSSEPAWVERGPARHRTVDFPAGIKPVAPASGAVVSRPATRLNTTAQAKGVRP